MTKVRELVAYANEPSPGEGALFLHLEEEVLRRVHDVGCVALTLMLTRCEERFRSSMSTRRIVAGREYQRR